LGDLFTKGGLAGCDKAEKHPVGCLQKAQKKAKNSLK
jgi:hypothetical protein